MADTVHTTLAKYLKQNTKLFLSTKCFNLTEADLNFRGLVWYRAGDKALPEPMLVQLFCTYVHH